MPVLPRVSSRARWEAARHPYRSPPHTRDRIGHRQVETPETPEPPARPGRQFCPHTGPFLSQPPAAGGPPPPRLPLADRPEAREPPTTGAVAPRPEVSELQCFVVVSSSKQSRRSS